MYSDTLLETYIIVILLIAIMTKQSPHYLHLIMEMICSIEQT